MLHILMLIVGLVSAEPVKVAVIDSGMLPVVSQMAPMCKTGHRDFTGTGMKDEYLHGTNVSGLINQHTGTTDPEKYCQIIIKVFSKKSNAPSPGEASIKAFKYVKTLNVDIVNYSAGGSNETLEETKAVKALINSGVMFISAAGNEGQDLSVYGYYPAESDPRVIVVGNTGMSSNYGTPVDIVIDGNKKSAYGITLSGSSQSTAIYTGLMIKRLINDRK